MRLLRETCKIDVSSAAGDIGSRVTYSNVVLVDEVSSVPDTFQFGTILSLSAFFASRKIN